MYDVASRTVIIKSATGENVGPSTYVVCNPRSRKQNCAPFLSTRSQSPSFVTKFSTDAIYNVREYREKIKGGSSLQNTAPRFVYRADDTPGPTRYTAKPIQCRKKKLKLDPTKPKLYACAVPYSLTVVAPSIPTKDDQNGYDIDGDGNIVKVPPDEEEPTEITIQSQFAGKRGWRWSCRTSERFDANRFKTCGPGPAAYTTKIPKCRRAEEDERFREMARLFSFVPRYVEAQELKAARARTPGPGTYDVSPAEPAPDRSKPIKPKPFINSTARFHQLVSETPAPTAYKICDCSRMHKQFSCKCAPFGFDSPRFQRKKFECSPGPASYVVKGALQAKMEKKRSPYALCDPPFNSTAVRSMSLVQRDAACTPSAAEYPQDEKCVCKRPMPILSSVFMSCSDRFVAPSDKKDFVGPAKYDIAWSFDRVRNRKCRNFGDVPFNSSGPRSTTPATKVGVPCSTSYELELSLCKPGFHFARDWRFKCEEETPGPGSYNIHPRLEKSTYKAVDTHNLRLKENVLRKKLRTAPRDTRKRWMSIMKKKKLLKWFDVELDYEERMILLIQELFDKPI
ncbi:sperm-tail PG-rich repeat-containing protein 2-like [Tenebrio molitor]|uniref:sperm-tail PG-rich repeat-containing protein 2-like n=1 Tax=Tenebrio molitor TaxID=7067 RepID=UPI00362486B3